MPQQTNRPHFHILKAAAPRKSGNAPSAWFRLAKSFNSNPAAFQWAKRNHPGAKIMIVKCGLAGCKPPLD